MKNAGVVNLHFKYEIKFSILRIVHVNEFYSKIRNASCPPPKIMLSKPKSGKTPSIV